MAASAVKRNSTEDIVTPRGWGSKRRCPDRSPRHRQGWVCGIAQLLRERVEASASERVESRARKVSAAEDAGGGALRPRQTPAAAAGPCGEASAGPAPPPTWPPSR